MSYIDDLHVEQERVIGSRIYKAMSLYVGVEPISEKQLRGLLREARMGGVEAIAAKVLRDMSDNLQDEWGGSAAIRRLIKAWANAHGIELSESPPISANRVRGSGETQPSD